MALLASIHPALVLLAVFAMPTVVTSTWRPAVERTAQERGAQAEPAGASPVHDRHDGAAGKGSARHRHRRAPGDESVGPRGSAWYAPGRGRAVGLGASGTRWRGRSSACAYVGAVVFVSSGLRAPASDVLLVLAAGARLSAYIGATVGEIGFLRGFWMDGSRRLAWLEDYAAAVAASGDLPVPAVLRRGIRLDHVSFAYPGTSRLVLDDVSLTLPAGAVVAHRRRERRRQDDARQAAGEDVRAVVRRRSSSTIRRCARVPAAEWRARLAGAFQDFFRFEFVARHTVGLGDVPRLDDEPRREPRRSSVPAPTTWSLVCRQAWIRSSVRPGREASSSRSANGRSSRWRAASCATIRCCWCSTSRRPRSTPRPSTRCSSATPRRRAAAGSARSGRITILVSHRFSTVRMADLIVVLDGARLVEVGTHDELMARSGQYSELYGIQAAAYR